jgi:hypothetical protein
MPSLARCLFLQIGDGDAAMHKQPTIWLNPVYESYVNLFLSTCLSFNQSNAHPMIDT